MPKPVGPEVPSRSPAKAAPSKRSHLASHGPNHSPRGALQRRMFDLLQGSSRTSIDSAELILRFCSVLSRYSRRLQVPAAVAELDGIVDELLSEALRVYELSSTLGSQIDSQAEEFVCLLSEFQRIEH